MTHKKKIKKNNFNKILVCLLIALVLAMSGFLAGCGGGSSSNGNNNPGSGSEQGGGDNGGDSDGNNGGDADGNNGGDAGGDNGGDAGGDNGGDGTTNPPLPTAVPLETPIMLSLPEFGNTLTWDAVLNAQSYKVFNNGDVIASVPSNSFSVGELAFGEYEFAVQAISNSVNFLDSYISDTLKCQKYDPDATALDVPQNVSLTGDNLTFGSVASATAYQFAVEQNSKQIPFEKEYTTTSIDLSMLTSGTYSVSVRAIANGNVSLKPSAWSSAVTYNVTIQTDPNEAKSRIETLLSKENYEMLFPVRFGTDLWKEHMTANYYPGEIGQSKTDFYSYEALVGAVEWIASKEYRLEEKLNAQGGKHWGAYQEFVIDKNTGNEILTSTGPTWDADYVNSNNGGTKITNVDYGSFLAEGDLNAQRRELSAFLANASHETGEDGWIDPYLGDGTGGLVWNEELSVLSSGGYSANYTDATNTQYPPVEGKSYHGRGPFQLSWNYNYGFFSELVYGDKDILLNNPEKLVEDGRLAFMTAIWFWMTPQFPKSSMHQAIVTPKEMWPLPGASSTAKKYSPSFALTIVIINGGFEANKDESYGQVARRIRFYKKFAEYTQADITGERLITLGWKAWDSGD